MLAVSILPDDATELLELFYL